MKSSKLLLNKKYDMNILVEAKDNQTILGEILKSSNSEMLELLCERFLEKLKHDDFSQNDLNDYFDKP